MIRIGLPTPAPHLGRFLRLIFVAAIGCSTSLGSEEVNEENALPLPEWDSQEWRDQVRQMGPPLANGLIPSLGEEMVRPAGVSVPVDPKYVDGPPALELDELDPSAPIGNASWFLPDALISRRESINTRLPTPTVQLREVVPEFISAAIEWPAEDPLIDPLFELPEMQAEDVRRFLGFHAEEAAIPLRVILIGRQNTLNQTADIQRIIQPGTTKLDSKRSALLIYPLGEPWRARLFLPPAAYQSVSPAFLSELIEACTGAASESSNTEAQLHEYLVQLSIRLFWMEKHLAKKTPTSAAEAHSSLSEVLPPTYATPPNAAPASHQQTSFIATLSLIAVFGCWIAIQIVRWSRRHWNIRRHRRIWTLPDTDPDGRLGGAFCGGGGAWGSWDI